MSYKIEIIDEYSTDWCSNNLRFATEAEAIEASQHLGGAGWNGIIDLRVVPTDDPANARWTESGATDKDGKPFHTPAPPPTPGGDTGRSGQTACRYGSARSETGQKRTQPTYNRSSTAS
jgi:hypothetical protein